jgi:uncharacterized protein (TIGR00251 family)
MAGAGEPRRFGRPSERGEAGSLKLTVAKDGSVTVDVRAKPNAKKSAITQEREGALEVRVAAPPVDGAANDELLRFLAATLGVPRRDVRLVRGTSSRLKRVEVHGLRVEDVRARLRVE